MLPITEKYLDNYNRPKRALKELKAIVIHWTANVHKGANAIRNRNYFNTKPFIKSESGKVIYASAHYLIDDSNIIKCIPDKEEGFHCGAKWSKYKEAAHALMGTELSSTYNGDSPNKYTIGIEMCVNVDGDFELTRQHTVELTQYLLQKYSLTSKNVYRHFDITGKDCPRMMLEDEIWQDFLDDVDNKSQPGNGPVIKGKVNAAELNVRKGPGTHYDIVKKAYNGEIVEEKRRNGKWIQVGDNQWVHSLYILPL